MFLVTLLACAHRDPSDPADSDAPPDAPPAGTLAITQLDLRGTIGESTLVVGPDGTVVLIDVGNDAHAAEVADAVEALTGARRVDAVVLTHHHTDHAGAFATLALDVGVVVHRGAGPTVSDTNERVRTEVLAASERVDLCDELGCPNLPWRHELGGGASLTLFAANATIGDAQLGGDLEENTLSVVGTVTFGDFDYVFAGDLTGGGKRTPDAEGFFADHLDPWVPPTGADVLHLSHHGIDSSTHDAWIDRMFPEDGATRHAVVGTNGVYLDAPADEVLDRLRGRLGDGRVWVTTPGLLTGADPLLTELDGPVPMVVQGDGAYTIGGVAARAIP